jgi:hypothetical protein
MQKRKGLRFKMERGDANVTPDFTTKITNVTDFFNLLPCL